jgi:hypothetical protein
MSKRKKQKMTIWDLGRLETMPVPKKGDPTAGETLAQYKRRKAAEAKAEHEKTLREFEQVNTRLATEYFEVLRKFWSRDIPTLAKVMSKREALEQMGCCDDIGLPTGTRDEAAAGKATRAFVAALPNRGITLSDEGKTRFMMYIAAQLMGLDVAITEESLQTMLDRFISIDAFADGEITIDESKQPRKVVQPTPEPKVDLEALNISGNSEHERLARKTVTERMYAEGSPLHQEWMDHLYRRYAFVPTRADLEYLYGTTPGTGWFVRSNMSYVDRRSFDAAKRHMVSVGKWPESLLSADELTSRWIESGAALSTLDFDERQRLRKRIQLLTDQTS